MNISTPYTDYVKTISEDSYKLICIPCAGAGASFYINWQKAIGSGVDILPVALPGREKRLGEELIHDCFQAADEIADALLPYVRNGNFSVFGHSMGGIIAYETAKSFLRHGVSPDICFISSTSIEDWSGVTPSEELDDNEFFRRVSQFGGIDESSELIRYPEFRNIFMKILRADFGIIESYKYDSKKLRCPAVCLCGDSDPMETIENMRSWKNYVEDENVVYLKYNGDHFYLNKQLEIVCRDIREMICVNRTKRRDLHGIR
ncbi:MAG: alpha/beta fold hydrolase [Oscillospiraceae bacterium]|nr:alpha/beta fold hydrolase [Oscillospiraceae bacterium]